MGKDWAGLVVVALAGLWIVYLVPQLLRYRQELADARVDDRFSEHLRVLRAASDRTDRLTAAGSAPSQGRVLLHPRGGDRAMHRPPSVTDRVIADGVRLTAAEHAARATALARRAAAARRRAMLATTLLVTTLVAWVGVPVWSLAPALAAVPTVLLGAVLVAGRRAVLAGQRNDARWAEGAARRAARPRPSQMGRPLATGRAVHPSEAITEIIERVQPGPARAQAERVLATGELPVVRDGDAPATSGPAARPAAAERPAARRPGRPGRAGVVPAATAQGGSTAGDAEEAAPGTWVPVPVPPPAYTLKPAVRRAEPRPLSGSMPVVPEGHAGYLGDLGLDDEIDDIISPLAGTAEERPTTGGLELDAILARRRAVGQ